MHHYIDSLDDDHKVSDDSYVCFDICIIEMFKYINEKQLGGN